MSGHRLVSTRRRVRDVEMDAYRREWGVVRKAVEAAGAKAWGFKARHDRHERLEFIEFTANDPRTDPNVAAALERLQKEHPGRTEEWEES